MAPIAPRRRARTGPGSCVSPLKHWSMARSKCVLTRCGPGQHRSVKTSKCLGTVVLTPYMKYMKTALPKWRRKYLDDPKYASYTWREVFSMCAKQWKSPASVRKSPARRAPARRAPARKATARTAPARRTSAVATRKTLKAATAKVASTKAASARAVTALKAAKAASRRASAPTRVMDY